MILEKNKNFNIVSIQESSWSIIYKILNSMSEEEEGIMEATHHSSWIMFARSLLANNNYSRVIIYINIKLIKLLFLLMFIQMISRLS